MKSLVIALSLLLYGFSAHASNIVYLNCSGFADIPSPLAVRRSPHFHGIDGGTIIDNMHFTVDFTDKTIEWSVKFRDWNLKHLTQIKSISDTNIHAERFANESIDIDRVNGDITIYFTPEIVLWKSDECKVIKPLL